MKNRKIEDDDSESSDEDDEEIPNDNTSLRLQAKLILEFDKSLNLYQNSLNYWQNVLTLSKLNNCLNFLTYLLL